jgi:8-oxo-dGTP pyrophosphatase MutT (NUDIX family)
MTDTFYAGGFFYNKKKQEVLLHKRDDKTIWNPNKWGFFGGLSEDVDHGKPLQTFIREIKEELAVTLSPEEVTPLCNYVTGIEEAEPRWRHVFYVVSDKPKSEMVLGEGADFDWIPLDKVFEYDLSHGTVKDLNTFLKTL